MKSLSLRILSEKLRFSCFSQVPTGSDYPYYRPILHYSLHLLIFTVLHIAGFLQIAADSDTPFSDLYCRKFIYHFDFFTVLFCDYTTLLCHRFCLTSCYHSVSCDKAHHHSNNCYDCPELMFLQHVKISFLDEPKPCVAL